MFIGLAKKNWGALNDKHCIKNDVWKNVLKETEIKYYIDAENSIEKLRLKWQGLWNGYKEYVKDTEKTGSGVDTQTDPPPFLDEIIDIVSTSVAVHPEYVSDTFSPFDSKKWSSDAFKSRTRSVKAGRDKSSKSPIAHQSQRKMTSLITSHQNLPQRQQRVPTLKLSTVNMC